MKTYRILAINPGSTSTKLALFDDDQLLLESKAVHESAMLQSFSSMEEQMQYRADGISKALSDAGYDVSTVDVYVGRGGGLKPCEGGTFLIDDVVVNDARTVQASKSGGAAFGPQIASLFADRYGKTAYFVNSPDVDEFDDLARVTGIPGIYRTSRFHTLNHKETAARDATAQGRRYDEMNYIVAHIGGGISVAAHMHGRAVDATDLMGGDSPMAPTRSGCLPAVQLAEMCFSGNYTYDDIYKIVTTTGGLVAHLGTSEMPEIHQMIKTGDKYAELIYDALIYQLAKYIGSMAAVLSGNVDAILLTGGIAFDKNLVHRLTQRIQFIAPVRVYPGSFEMEAMAAGALRVLRGEENVKTYTGKPLFEGFDHLKKN